MPNQFYGYKDRLWKEINKFTYTGQPQQFTLDPGTYLLMCNGARGGSGGFGNNHDFKSSAFGGVAYGVLTLDSQQTLYAYVGGNGGDAPTSPSGSPGAGGWNGGGNGGLQYSGDANAVAGAGGGGASDIRLYTPAVVPEYIPELPDEYQQVEYIETDGTQYLNTGYTAYRTSSIEMKLSVDSNDSRVIFGSRESSSDTVNRWSVKSSTESVIPLIPSMISDTSPMGHVEYGGNYGYGNYGTLNPWNIFDGNMTTYLRYQKENVTDGWFSFEFTSATYVDYLVAYMGNYRATNDIMAAVYVYDDQNNETLIDTVHVTGYADGTYGTFTFNVNATIKKFKFVFGYKTTNTNVMTYEVQAYAVHTSPIVILDNTFGFQTSSQTATNIAANAATQLTFSSKEIFDATNNARYELDASGFASSAPIYLFANYDLATSSVTSEDKFVGKLYYARIYDTCPYYFEGPMSNIDVAPGSTGGFSVSGEGERIGSWETITSYYGPSFLSKNPNDVLYQPGGTYTGISFVYKNETWYISNNQRWQGSNPYDVSGQLQNGTFITTSGDAQQCIAFLDYITSIWPSPRSTKRLVAEYVPCYRKSDNVPGLYDTVSETFIPSASGSDFVAGPSGSFSLPVDAEFQSLSSRIIVAGGSGGGGNQDYNNLTAFTEFAGFGGGSAGGPIWAPDVTEHNKYSNQVSGYKFGIGQSGSEKTATANTSGTSGSGGGGGGWYGGYSIQTSGNNSSLAGSGGSGYISTQSSFRPDGYVFERVYLTDGFMSGCKSLEPSVSICALSDASEIETGDIISFFPVGDSTLLSLNPGSYQLTCYGCRGGGNTITYDANDSHVAKGGYAQGTLTTDDIETLRVYVGSSSVCDGFISNEYVHQSIPDIGMNGGGLPTGYLTAYQLSASLGNHGFGGGGASDIRIITGVEPTSGYLKTLPDAYQPIEYIRFANSATIDVGIPLDSHSNMEVKIRPDMTSSGWQCICGASKNNDDNDITFSYNVSEIGMHYGTRDQSKAYAFADKTYVISNRYDACFVDSDLMFKPGPDVTLDSVNNCILGKHGQTGYPFTGYMYYFILRQDRTVIRYMIPCIEISTSKIGMYDLITDTFHEPTDGSLTAGQNITQRTYQVMENEDVESSLMSRIVVAGGGGGDSIYNVGGNGGGTTGGAGAGTNGVCPGVPTSTESPQSELYPNINGGFGYGGNADIMFIGDTPYIGAAGGGGWYGGPGVYPTSAADIKGGAGGSGYVYANGSSTPVGYLPDEKYKLTDVVYTQPQADTNNASEMGYATIKALDIHADTVVLMLCRDNDGIKYFDTTNNRWTYLTTTLTADLFSTHGTSEFTTDAGLLDDYEILFYDQDDTVTDVEFEVVPAAQTYRLQSYGQYGDGIYTSNGIPDDPKYCFLDADIPEGYTVTITDFGYTEGAYSSYYRAYADISINKTIDTNEKLKIYSIKLTNKQDDWTGVVT